MTTEQTEQTETSPASSEHGSVVLLLAIPYLLIGLVVALSRLDPMAMFGTSSFLAFVGTLFGWPLVLLVS